MKARLSSEEKVRVVKSKQEHLKRRGRLSLPVKVAVTKRDEGRCTYVDPKTERRCTARTHLHYDHIVPFAVGGESTVDNIRLICRNHNQFLAKEYFGKDKVEREIAKRKRGDGER